MKFVVHFKPFILDGYEDPEGVRRWLGLMTLLWENWSACSDPGYFRQRKRKQEILQEFHGLLQGVPSDKH